MVELKYVLIFISFSFRKFFINFLFYLAYFFPVFVLTVFIFFFSFRAFGNYYLFLVYLIVMVIIHSQVKKVFLKRQLSLNLVFVDFLEKKDKEDLTLNNSGDLSLKKLKEIKADLTKRGVGFISNKLLLAVASLRFKGGVDSFDNEELRKLEKETLKYMFYEVIIFFIILVPFSLISFLFTRGFVVSIQLLIYLLGYLFVYFLNSAMFDPLIYLIIQAMAYKKEN